MKIIIDDEDGPGPLVVERIALENNTEFPDMVTLRLEGGFYASK